MSTRWSIPYYRSSSRNESCEPIPVFVSHSLRYPTEASLARHLNVKLLAARDMLPA